MKYLFIFALGPVQEFISTARSSRDLQYGSWMLSELSKAAARNVAGQADLDALIFPAPVKKNALEPDPESNLNVANKIVAVMDVPDPGAVAEKVKHAVDSRLEDLKRDAFSQIKGHYYQKVAEEQVQDLVEFYWSAVPYHEDHYTEVRETAERLLAARKNTRDFKQLEGSHAPKSSLDGSRESVIPEEVYPQPGASAQDRQISVDALYSRYKANPGERLSGVDLLKRLGGSRKKGDENFPSTSSFAAGPFLDHLGPDGSRQLLEDISRLYVDAGIELEEDDMQDPALLYSSRLPDRTVQSSKQKDLQKDLQFLLRDAAGGQQPSPYYALLRADGDSMGALLNAQDTIDQHRKFSRALSDFAQSVPEILRKYQGQAIYSGGDDILAYLPLHTALACLDELEKAFRETMRNFQGVDANGNELKATLSGGLVVAHHLMSLSEVLAHSHRAEQAAKQVPGKNALVILADKRSGGEREIKGKWRELSERFQMLVDYQRQDALSAGTAYELQQLANLMDGGEVPREALNMEALRILKRKRESGGDKKAEEKLVNQFSAWLEESGVSIEELALEMIIAGMFAEAQDTAGLETQPEKGDRTA